MSLRLKAASSIFLLCGFGQSVALPVQDPCARIANWCWAIVVSLAHVLGVGNFVSLCISVMQAVYWVIGSVI